MSIYRCSPCDFIWHGPELLCWFCGEAGMQDDTYGLWLLKHYIERANDEHTDCAVSGPSFTPRLRYSGSMDLDALTQASHARYVASRLTQAQKVWPATTQADLDRYDAERQANGPLHTLALHTRVPSKWLMVDRETGQQWEWRDVAWRAAILPEGPYGGLARDLDEPV